MKLKIIFQTILILTIFIIIIAFYYTFFTEKNKDIENLSSLDDTKKIETEINEKVASELINIEYINRYFSYFKVIEDQHGIN